MKSDPFFYSIPPQLYDDQFWWKKDDIEFWKNNFQLSSSILELAAGTGRLGVPLIKEGFDYQGLELSKEYCDFANNKLNCDNKKFICADMRSFQLKKKFDIIFIPFNSLLHLLSETDLKKTLKSIKKHMHIDSELFIDIFMPHNSYLYKSVNQKRIEFYNSKNKKDTIVRESLNYDSLTEIISVKWNYEHKKKIYDTFHFKMKIYYPDTMNRILVDAGFKIINLWGDYNQSKFSLESNLQIYQSKINNL